jgi:hypothetical protein
MTEHEPLVRWRSAAVGVERLMADLPNGCFASLELWQDGLCYAMIGCDGQQPLLITDIFADRAVAQAWVEDKAQLLDSGRPIRPPQT